MEESRIKHRGIMSAELSEFCAKATYQLQITIPNPNGATRLQESRDQLLAPCKAGPLALS